MRTLVVILSALLACCASAGRVREVTAWTLPLSASDADRVCAVVMDYPGKRCMSAGEFRSYLRSVKAD